MTYPLKFTKNEVKEIIINNQANKINPVEVNLDQSKSKQTNQRENIKKNTRRKQRQRLIKSRFRFQSI